MDKLVLIDGNSLINRAFYAMPLLSTRDGEYTNAVFGFMNMFFKMIEDLKPTHCVVAFDLKAPTFRHKMYTEYKGTRKPMPEELRPQIPLLKEVLSLMGVKTIEKEGYEADDIIGTIAKNTDVSTVIITGDKDSFQLVDEQTEVYFTKRGVADLDVYSNANFTEKTGISPWQIIELKALMGDTSDNIPGIKGIGEKTAINLLQTYSSVDGVYQNVDKLKGKLKEKIEEGKESCYLSKTLATIKTDCEIDYALDTLRLNTPFPLVAKRKFKDLQFKALSAKEGFFESEDQSAESNLSGFSVETIAVDDLNALDQISADVISACVVSQDFYLFNGEREYLIHVKEGMLDVGFFEGQVIEKLKSIFSSAKKIILYSKKDFRHRFFTLLDGIDSAKIEDLSIAKYLTDYSGRGETLQETIEYYGYEFKNPSALIYNIFNSLYQKIVDEGVEELYRKVELPLADLLYDMEITGFKLDVDALNELGREYSQEISAIESKIKEYANEPTLNLNSSKQLGHVLFEKLNLAKGKKTKKGFATSAEVLEELIDLHPIVGLILKYRKLQKINSTYIEGFKPLIDKATGLIKTSFNQTVTATGRLSSKEPNLQNIPVRDEEGKKLRKFFVPRDSEHIIISADYSQIELRLLAAFSGCKDLISAFKEEKDIHKITASKVFKIPLESVTDEMRRTAKAVNFGIIYGISEYGLAKNIKTSAYEAREYISSYFKEYPEVKEYMEKNKEFARKHGYAETLLKRRRYIKEINASNYALRMFGERAAMNMPLQGSSADIIKIAMLNVAKRLNEEGLKSKLILQVHDELIIDALKTEKEQVEKLLIQEMQNAVSLSVPLTVSKASGENWYEAK